MAGLEQETPRQSPSAAPVWDLAEWSKYSRGEKPADWAEQQPPVGQAGGLTRVRVEDGPGKTAGCCRSVRDKERISFCFPGYLLVISAAETETETDKC